jgi:coenzyme PQQ precursor peptide PqqA
MLEARQSCRILVEACGDFTMTWKTPKIVEVHVGLEINMYACAVRK